MQPVLETDMKWRWRCNKTNSLSRGHKSFKDAEAEYTVHKITCSDCRDAR